MDNKNIVKVIFLAVCTVYVALRLWRLCDSCLWFDEIFSIHASEMDWAEMLRFTAKDLIHPPFSYILLKLWIMAGGDSLVWLRLFPVFFSVLTIIPFWLLSRELKISKPAALTGLFLVAVNGALVKYSQEVRMYAPLLFFSVMSIWLFARFYFRGKSYWVLVAVNILLVHTHYFGWFVVAAELSAVLIARRPKFLRTFLMTGLTAVAFVPWIYTLYIHKEPTFSLEQNIGWIKRPFLREIFDLVIDLFDPVYSQLSSAEPSANLLLAVPVVLVIAAAKIFYLSEKRDPYENERLVFLAVFAAVPTTAVLALSWVLPYSIWGSRHLLIIFVPVLLLAGIFISDIKDRRIRYSFTGFLIVLAFVALSLDIWRGQRSYIWCAWEPLAKEWITYPQGTTTPATLYVFEDLVAYNYWFATRNVPNRRIVLLKGVEGTMNDPAYFLPRGFDGIEVTDLDGVKGDEVWVSFREAARPEPVGAHRRSNRQFEIPVTYFENLGYVVEDVKQQARGPQTAYLILVRRVESTSAEPVR